MLIYKLVKYAETEGLAGADPYFETKPIRWLVEILPDGTFVQLLPLGDGKRGKDYKVPKKVGGNAGGVATFATDNPRFVLGFTENADDQAKAERDLPAFSALIDMAAKAQPDNAEFAAAQSFYAHSDQVGAAREAAVSSKVKDGDRIALSVTTSRGVPIFDSGAGQAFWRAYRKAQDASKKASDAVLCLSCGDTRPPVATSEKLMGVPDGQPSGTSLVSFDKDAFQSLGWDQNKNAPVCGECSFAYTQALNHLLKRGPHDDLHGGSRRTRIDLGGVAYIFWTDSGGGGSFIDDFFEQPDPEEAGRLLGAARRGQYPVHAPDDRLYAVGLRGNGGRAVVVDWFDVALDEAYVNVVRWFDDLQIRLLFDEKEKGVTYKHAGDLSRPPRLWALEMATAREEKEISPRLPGFMLRAALRGEALPLTVAEACLGRLAVDHDNFGDFFAPARIGLIRCTLNRRLRARQEEEVTIDVDSERHSGGYLAGRAFAMFERIQYLAERTDPSGSELNKTVGDSYYGRASVSPGTVYPLLVRLAKSHLSVLRRRQRQGLASSLESELLAVMGQISAETFSRPMQAEAQMEFVLGYASERTRRFQQASADVSAEDDEAPTTEPDEDDQTDEVN